MVDYLDHQKQLCSHILYKTLYLKQKTECSMIKSSNKTDNNDLKGGENKDLIFFEKICKHTTMKFSPSH
jgi:hypothetical protein